MASKKITLHGKISFSLDRGGLEARLHFAPGPFAASVDRAGLMEMLRRRGVTAGVSESLLDGFLDRLAGAKEPFSAVAASGIPPREGEPEKALWRALPVPQELREEAEKVFAEAGPPVLFEERVEKIVREEIVLKKPALPFLSPTREKVEKVEKRTVRERIAVDPAVRGTGHAAAGMRIAVLIPAKPGEPGKSVTGAALRPAPAENLRVHAGAGVLRKGDELVAAATGFVRWGANWVEILSPGIRAWGVALSADRAGCLLSLDPGAAGKKPSGGEILEAAKALGCDPSTLLPEKEIDDLVLRICRDGKSVAGVPVSTARDGSVELKITDDKMKAVISVRKGRGAGKPLALRDVGDAIRKSGLRGLDLQKIRTDITDFYRSGATDLEDYVLAEGKSAAPGADREAEFTVEFVSPAVLAELKKAAADRPAGLAGIDSVSAFPPEAAGALAFVEKDQQILSFIPGEPGVQGVDVFGRMINPPPNRTPAVVLRENVERRRDIFFSRIKGVLERRDTGEGIELRVRPHRDGEIRIGISADRMQGTIGLRPSRGTGKPLSAAAVAEAVAAAGVIRGIREDILREALEKAASGGPAEDIPFAFGVPARDGSARNLKFLIHVASGSGVSIRKDGTADYKNRDVITSVDEGALIAEILPPETQPEDGWDITGKILPAKNPADKDIETGRNIRREERDGKTFLIAAKSGRLVVEGSVIDIQDGFVVKGNVDLKTGNIRFHGSVSVQGSVASGFCVFSKGDIRILEGIDAALLSAEGAIVIAQGIKGAGKAVLRAKKGLASSFAEQATILSVGDVRLKNGCVRCSIKCNGKLELSSDRGNLIGGEIRARRGVDAASIGTERGIRTEISFGQDYVIGDAIEKEEKEILNLNQASGRIDRLMRECEKNGNRVELERLRAEKLGNLKLVEKLSLRLFTLREQFEEHHEGEIRVRGTIHPGVVIESHGRYYEITAPKKSVRIFFNPKTGRIVEEPLDKKGP